jgi:formyltetrahydrofolate deformylase
MAEARQNDPRATLLASAPLRMGLAAGLTGFIHANGWRIRAHDHWVDHDEEYYFTRIVWEFPDDISSIEVRERVDASLSKDQQLTWQLWFDNQPTRIAVFVTREMAHLYEMAMHCISGLWHAEIAMVISNREDLRAETERFNLMFHHIPITEANKAEQENKQLRLLQAENIDLVVLARYMQIVTDKLIGPFQNRIINIHHSMLPAFAGAKPYHQAYKRGVKLIGATSHYVSEELDAGPIIAQDVAPVTHRKSVEELVQIGRQLETRVLARATKLHVEHRVIAVSGRTVVFD